MPKVQCKNHGPVVLVVRDGWGRNPNRGHDSFNAIKLAATPVSDRMLRQYPWTLIRTSGEDVGLPDGTMGNSEVGHQNLGAGRVVDQESVRITNAIRSGAFFTNSVLVDAIRRSKDDDRYLHLMGIASDAGVHGQIAHLQACLELAKKVGHQRVALHLFTDGRDTGPFTGKKFIAQIQELCQRIGIGQIASVCGRYYAMDRDNRWQRIQQAYQCLVGHQSTRVAPDPIQAVVRYYNQPASNSQQGDEFILPTAVGEDWRETRVGHDDTVVFYNYRGDRPREIIKAFVFDKEAWQTVPVSPDTGEHGFDRGEQLGLHFVTLTAYEHGLPVQVAFPRPPAMTQIAGEYLSDLGLSQFRCAETEKFPHVTFFFNDYRDPPFGKERRQMAQSPKVATYDLEPQMSAQRITETMLNRLSATDCEDFLLVNYANGDMVGHTGVLEAAVEAVETVDSCVGQIVQATAARNGKLIITADHGNAEQMFDPVTQAAHTAHTTYDVECIIVDPSRQDIASGSPEQPCQELCNEGCLADVFPTVLTLMDLAAPKEMTGRSLLA
ncbi:MAG: phosphoglycerate mutase (2,3-diphosphoglycerate-independent) [Phycisphaeraceae bacterium]|nr:phosphoglycerate mutase (2,3-diphosphoglycerate-independent) [Phycisphaeraceae bacterium]